MHDIDGTRLEANDYNEAEGYEELGDEFERSGEFEFEDAGEMDEFGEVDELEGEFEAEDSSEVLMTEAEEEEMAAELLGVSTEEELDHFLGGLFKKIKQGVSGAARFLSQSGFPLSAALKSLAQRALPFIGGAIGTAIPIPGLGTLAGSALGKAASSLLQSEMEQFELEDQEFQMAKRFVRLASQAIRQGTRIPPRYHPTTAANLAVRNALRRFRNAGGFRYRAGYRPGYRQRYSQGYRPGYRRYAQGYRPGYGGYGGYGSGYRYGRGQGRYWRGYRPGYGAGYPSYAGAESCPPCPQCPTCAQPVPPPDVNQDTTGGTGGTMGGGTEGGGDTGADSGTGGTPPPNAGTGTQGTQGTNAQGAELSEEIIEEFGSPEQEHDEVEGEFYETEYGGAYAPYPGGGRSGRWVRRGKRIIIHGL